MNRYIFIMLPLTFAKVAWASDSISELDFFSELPVVLSASRLSQPLSEAPNAMTVIDRDMIKASGFRVIADIFRLVPGMLVSASNGWQPAVAYHGSTDDYARRMQVRVDGRSIYMPPLNSVAWEDLPLQIEDIERIEVIRGPAAASYGGNSTQGVINIITRDAGTVQGFKAHVNKGNGGIADASASLGKTGNMLDYRISVGYRSDHGYDAVFVPYDGWTAINNDSYQTRLFNLRTNYHPDARNSLDFQLGYTSGSRGDGIDKPGGDPNSPHDRHNNEHFAQLALLHNMEHGDELKVQYYHIYQDVLNAIGPVAPFPALSDSWTNTRNDLELQHTLHTSPDNRLVWGASTRSDWTRAEHRFLSQQTVHQNTLFAHNEWRISPKWLLNIGALQESDSMGAWSTSPRATMIHKLSESQTLRLGIAAARRNPSLYEEKGNYHFPELGATIFQASGGLKPESILSREVGYVGEFQEYGTTIDLRIYHDQLRDIIFTTDTNPVDAVNMFDAWHKGIELSTKHHWGVDSELTFNYAWQLLYSPFITAPNGTPYSESMPRNILGALYSTKLNDNTAMSLGYYQQDSMLPIDRPDYDRQQLTRRMDARLAWKIRRSNDMETEVAWVVQGIFAKGHVDYMNSNVYQPRTYLSVAVAY